MYKKITIVVLLFLSLLPGLNKALAAPVFKLSIKDYKAHNKQIYTQGLFFYEGRLYESGGLYGQSALYRHPAVGQAGGQFAKLRLEDQFFAEGATEVAGDVYLLTWKENTGFVIDPETMALKRHFNYEGEGWGLAWDGKLLWRSDGSSHLFPHRPGDFDSAGEALTVKDGDREVGLLNELEWDSVTGLMLANVYGMDVVAAIDMNDGQVRFWLDASQIRKAAMRDGLSKSDGKGMDVVLNGLAINKDGLWLTGKCWPSMYLAPWPPQDFTK